jgi:hypothetical protein
LAFDVGDKEVNRLFWNTVSEAMRTVLLRFFQSRMAEHFYLAGGTALTLQIGHRQSADLDLFSPTLDIPTSRKQLEEALAPGGYILADSAWGNLVYLVQGVRVGFYGYGFPLVRPLVEVEGTRLASNEDIALMKLDALLSRAARKDFYDLYFICKQIPLQKIFNLAPSKYPSVRDFETQTVKRLVYFENAEGETDPALLQPVSWKAVKKFLVQQAREIQQGWLK